MQSEAMPANVIVKHTFLDFSHEDHSYQLRRNSSEPSLAFPDISKLRETLEYPEATTPTTCASVNGDDDATTELSDDVWSMSAPEVLNEVRRVVKNTFIEFKPIDTENGSRLRRVKSDSSLLDLTASFGNSLISEGCDSESLASTHVEYVETTTDELAVRESWADSVPDEEEEPRKRTRGGRVRSGRTRQREARRRRMRTPSPEARLGYH